MHSLLPRERERAIAALQVTPACAGDMSAMQAVP